MRTRWVIIAACAALVACPGPAPVADAGPKLDWTVAFDATSTGWLLDSWGTSTSNVYMVGGSLAQAVVMRFDGAQWAPVSLGVAAPLANWCHGFGPDDVTIVGNGGTVLHWDGKAWTKQPTPTTQDLWGVWGAAPNDLWSVGGDGLADGHATLLHYDGVAWAQQALPPMQKANVWQLLKVWGTGADNVYVVGQRGVVLHKKGAQWAEELVGASDDLVSLWGTGPDRIVAVGGRANGIASVWDGMAWHTTALAPLPGLNGIWMRTPTTAHVAGAYGTLGVLDLKTMTVRQVDPFTKLDFHSVFGVGGRLFAVGGNLASANPSSFQGLAYTRLLASDE